MKKILEITVVIKNVAGLVFAGMLIAYVLIGSFFGLTSITFSLIWQAAAISIITGGLHYIAFTDNIIKKVRSSMRFLLFAIPLFIILAVFAVIFQWFQLNVTAWLLFTLIFIILCGILTSAFEIYSKITGKKYNECLGAYQRKNESP